MPKGKWSLDDQLNLAQWLSWIRDDKEMTWADVSKSRIKCDQLVRLNQFPELTYVGLDDRQLGPGLEDLKGHQHLHWLSVHDASDGHLAEFVRLPQLRSLELFKPKPGNLGLGSLRSLTDFKQLTVLDCEDLSGVLQQIQGLNQFETIDLERSTGFSDEDLKCLSGFTSLKHVCLMDCSSIGDIGLRHLSQLESLDSLVLTGSLAPISDDGIQSLAKLKNLTQLVFSGKHVPPDQVQTLRRSLPACLITVR